MSAMCDLTSPWKTNIYEWNTLKPSDANESVHKESVVF